VRWSRRSPGGSLPRTRMLKRNIPLLIVFATAVLLIVAFFIPHKPFGDL
jgi:hypothetical protein